MSREIIACHRGTSLEEACDMLVRHGVHRLLVLDGAKKLAGILSATDVVKALVAIRDNKEAQEAAS